MYGNDILKVSPFPYIFTFLVVRGKEGVRIKKERYPFCKACVIIVLED